MNLFSLWKSSDQVDNGVAQVSQEMLRETKQKELDELLEQACRLSRQCGLSLEELTAALETIYKEN